ncbi:hypothetical protein [Desertihabitans aurantiacus]|uniref:hypothetical protein n=1 Tax=Desertihabitans aurantiacus TaxID=2282477 RepID=UPI001300665C|nr:hypothetical protein [Desertihabitans aurantiacus]
MRVPLPPNPAELLGRGAEALEQLTSLLPRTVALLERAERAAERAEALLDRSEVVVAEAELAARRTQAVVERAEGVSARAEELLASYTGPLTRLQPAVARLAESTDPHEVQAVVAGLDLLPRLVDDLRRDVLPVMSTLGDVAPDLHGVLRVVTEINEMLGSIPGLKGVKRRVDAEHAAEQATRD